MGIQLVTLERVKEQAFAQDILAFATAKYKAATTKGWRVMVQHVSDPVRWMDLYDAARYSGQDPATWPTCDAWSMAWDEPVAGGWVHTTDPRRRKMLARRMELENVDPFWATDESTTGTLALAQPIACFAALEQILVQLKSILQSWQ